MNLLPDAEQTQLLDAAFNFLSNEAPVRGGESAADVRARMGRPFWRRVAELGWIGLGLDETEGGVGYTLAEEALFFREYGRRLVSPLALGATLGARLAAKAGKGEIAQSIIGGESLVGLAIGLKGGRIGAAVDGPFQTIESDGADYVLFADEESAALIPASAIAQGSRGDCIDGNLTLDTVTLSDASPAAWVDARTDDVFMRGVVLTGAMLAGSAEASRDIATDYAKVRVQFGQPIGAFQAVKHRLSDMAVRCEAATSAVLHAALCVRDNLPTAKLDAAAAKAVAAEAAIENASGAVQVHGGMGFTEQTTPHLYVKRARVLDQLFGDRRTQLATVLAAAAA